MKESPSTDAKCTGKRPGQMQMLGACQIAQTQSRTEATATVPRGQAHKDRSQVESSFTTFRYPSLLRVPLQISGSTFQEVG